MGRFTNIQTDAALKKYQENPTLENELNYLTWKKRQLSESPGFSTFIRGQPCFTENTPRRIESCTIISKQYPLVIARIEEINKILAQQKQEQADIKQPEIILTNQETVQEQLQEKPQIQTTQDNTLRNVLLIGGALAIL